MPEISYTWHEGGVARTVTFARVEGTRGMPYRFGTDGGEGVREIEVKDFFFATTPATQSFWVHVMGQPHSCGRTGPLLPQENVSWDELVQSNGFFARLAQSGAGRHLLAQTSLAGGTFRLPSETEWEYAARGGPHWRDGYRFSGSNDVDLVAWHDRKGGDHTHEVAQKAPNQLGLFDMRRLLPQLGDPLHGVEARYQMDRQYHDGCIGFRVVMAVA